MPRKCPGPLRCRTTLVDLLPSRPGPVLQRERALRQLRVQALQRELAQWMQALPQVRGLQPVQDQQPVLFRSELPTCVVIT